MICTENAIRQGWEFYSRCVGTQAMTSSADKYVEGVQKALVDMKSAINKRSNGYFEESLAGFLAEDFHVGTFNLNAAAAESKSKAKALVSNKAGSTDVELTSSGKGESPINYSMKYYKTAEKSAAAQRVRNKDGTRVYDGQSLVIPADQLEEASRKYPRENFRDRIADNKGITSEPLTREEALEMAREKKQYGEPDWKKHGLTENHFIPLKQVWRKAMEGGASASMISVALQLTPEVCKMLLFLRLER